MIRDMLIERINAKQIKTISPKQMLKIIKELQALCKKWRAENESLKKENKLLKASSRLNKATISFPDIFEDFSKK